MNINAAEMVESKSSIRKISCNHRHYSIERCKVVMVGDACTGKTSIAQRFSSDGKLFPKSYQMTTGVDFTSRKVKLSQKEALVDVLLYDCAGHGIFAKAGANEQCWVNADFIILVFDVSNRESFHSCGRWLQSVRAANSFPVPGVLIANKLDLAGVGQRIITKEEAVEFSEENGLQYFEVSAVENRGIENPFKHIAELIWKRNRTI